MENLMSVSKQFILAGDAVFTIEVPATHQKNLKPHYTYKVQRVEANDRWPESYFVKILIGPDNTCDYVYLGKLDPFTGQLTVTGKSRRPQDDPSVRIFNKTLARIWADDHQAYEQFGFRTHHEGRCGRCGRVLTVPSSVESGIGPLCQEALQKKEVSVGK